MRKFMVVIGCIAIATCIVTLPVVAVYAQNMCLTGRECSPALGSMSLLLVAALALFVAIDCINSARNG